MKERSRARGIAVQALYAWESRSGDPADLVPAFMNLTESHRISPRNRLYTEVLVRLVARRLTEIDRLIGRSLTNWTLPRLSVIDRSILRIGVAEFLYVDDVPPDVVLKEMARLAERFGTSESPRFIRGVLEAIIRDIEVGGHAAVS